MQRGLPGSWDGPLRRAGVFARILRAHPGFVGGIPAAATETQKRYPGAAKAKEDRGPHRMPHGPRESASPTPRQATFLGTQSISETRRGPRVLAKQREFRLEPRLH